ncbi:hypothetical protein SELMODRAFT_92047 [Selaginella moellendorffii]|uniref:Sodium/calcium exchanger membrane region domain-containing protein n=1 Tax=Selaginella moellendorffii TaxID=88036 RepID=D8RER9_SELML|nr:hypothetical protein SELMODRAFT_92047 [Selaginella moellendorffii]
MRSVLGLASWAVLLLFLSGRIPSNPAASSHSRGRALLDLALAQPAAAPNHLIGSGGCDSPGKSHDACSFVKAHARDCASGGAIDYTRIFFCRFGALPWLGHLLLGIWLASLFYMLGNTAADYFCCSLQKLSSLLHLPPTVAGVSLLPLGNGAPDVFASIAAFVGAGAGEVGLNSVLGGAVFVTSVVAGLVYVITAGRTSSSVQLDRHCFIRDVCFFLVTLAILTIILYVGRISFWGAVAFVSIYLVYAVTVAASEVIKKQASKLRWLPMQAVVHDEDPENNWYTPLMDPDSSGATSNPIEITLPQWRWASHVAIYAHQQPVEEAVPRPLWGWSEQQEEHESSRNWKSFLHRLFKMVIDWPLTIPRQLTIPLVEDKRWSRPVAVASVTLAPVLLAFLLSAGVSPSSAFYVYSWGFGSGAVLGLTAFFVTTPDHPPRSFVFPWVVGGFLMSIVWFYIIAKELVAVLVSLGVILEIDSSLLGLTVLAWGNSMGDLMANVAMAFSGGDGAQVAVSGCYAGPMFNTLVGLGISLLLASLKTYPASFVVPSDPSLYYTIGFLVVGLIWTLLLLPGRRMQPSRALGIGLLVLYSSFLGMRVFQTFVH